RGKWLTEEGLEHDAPVRRLLEAIEAEPHRGRRFRLRFARRWKAATRLAGGSPLHRHKRSTGRAAVGGSASRDKSGSRTENERLRAALRQSHRAALPGHFVATMRVQACRIP